MSSSSHINVDFWRRGDVEPLTMNKKIDKPSKGSVKALSLGYALKLSVGIAFFAMAVSFYGFHIPSLIVTCLIQFKTGIHGYFGLGLLIHEPLSPVPISNYVRLGYVNSLQLKFIYVMRKWMEDNFLFDDWLSSVHNNILEDFERRNVPKDENSLFEIPSFEMNEIDPQKFYSDYVKMGRPVILKKVLDIPAMSWTPDIIAERAGDFSTTTRCMDGSTRKWTLGEYIASRNDTEHPCYFDNNAEIFEAKRSLEEELHIYRLGEYMTGKKTEKGGRPSSYVFSQMFLSVFNTTGALYHCANYNNLFYMIHGRKKWTFVDPSNSFLMYPMFNPMMKDSKSFLTWHATHSNDTQEIINRQFPLYRYAPKYVYTLEKVIYICIYLYINMMYIFSDLVYIMSTCLKQGDLLLNPPWNWHMVENLDVESIGIASRWFMVSNWPYTNGLFSFLQFSSWQFTDFMYKRIASKAGKFDFKYFPTSHQDLDTQVNFGNFGSVYEHREFVKPLMNPKHWGEYIDYLKSKNYDFNKIA
jgi:hypothetical protein